MAAPVSTIATIPRRPGKTDASEEPSRAAVERAPFGKRWSLPLPDLDSLAARVVCRMLMVFFGRRIRAIEGMEFIESKEDPFILALNHSQRIEALLVPAALAALRRGRLVHFMADWNFLLLPVVGSIIRLSQPIVVVRKDLKPRWLNFLKPRFASEADPFEKAAQRLRSGRSVGIFAEGTVNRNRGQLLRGLTGAARLSLVTGAPIVPAGIRFDGHPADLRISDHERFSIHFGKPLSPGSADLAPTTSRVAGWHAEIMSAIARLSGKSWSPNNPRTKNGSCPAS